MNTWFPKFERIIFWLIFFGMAMVLLRPGGQAEEGPIMFEKSEVSVESGDRTFEFEVELALSSEQRQRGLMYRRTLAADEGMLFDFGHSSRVSMWMRNTYIPLDMLFIQEDGRIDSIAHDTEPMSESIIRSKVSVRAVLELAAGTSRLLGINAGDMVRHPLFDGSDAKG